MGHLRQGMQLTAAMQLAELLRGGTRVSGACGSSFGAKGGLDKVNSATALGSESEV